ncbi:RNA polymerase sigma factor, sigma-70 family [Syntrophobotulus glycolicus DSM 8271]|uniref:RNA polymerase sigma factor, sigma-70 family n=1 Tax=Syntrophobotulus glycolicus (strain DSM 8271 / FlGlyR) TaxID=645991 RepID=F0STT7_SYNGF|nr:sigma-70 family RNA polymerase sigma factor [Syntrophobotulus glycolicus]ADY55377.1 RNA polymerase sigma factor, sigma-70 family [Syntrophobotulus glycolicus DSM 8271]
MWQWNRKNTDPFYEDLCNTYFHRIFLYCRRLIKGQEQLSDFAEECTQSTFLEARKQISTLKNHPNVEGWLYTTARNLINNSYRNMYIKKRREVSIDDKITGALPELDNKLEELFAATLDPDEISAQILRKLKQSEYDLYLDYYKGRLSVPELSQKYDISATAMTTRIYRLKRKIKEIVRAYFAENEI